MKTIHWIGILILVLIILFLIRRCLSEEWKNVVEVNCQDESLASAIRERANPGDTVVVIGGECRESSTVVVSKDGLVIDGQGRKVIGNGTAPVFKINVNVKTATIRNFSSIENGTVGILLPPGEEFTGKPEKKAIRNYKPETKVIRNYKLEKLNISKQSKYGILAGDEQKATKFLDGLNEIFEDTRPQNQPLASDIPFKKRKDAFFWVNQIGKFLFYGVKDAEAQIFTGSGVLDLCTIVVGGGEVGGVPIGFGIQGYHTKIKGCNISVTGNGQIGVVFFSNAKLTVNKGNFDVTNNNRIGVGAYNESKLDRPIDGNVQSSGHRNNLCLDSTSGSDLNINPSPNCPDLTVIIDLFK